MKNEEKISQGKLRTIEEIETVTVLMITQVILVIKAKSERKYLTNSNLREYLMQI